MTRADPKMHDPQTGAGTLQQWLRLSVAEAPCAVPIDRVREILEVGRMTPMPLTPPIVRGVMNLRGAVVPVIDLGERLASRPVPIGRRTCIVVVELPAQDGFDTAVMGLLADAVYEVMDVDTAAVSAVPPLGTSVRPEYLAGIHQSGRRQVLMLDLHRVLAQADLASLIAEHAGAAA